MVLLQHKLNVKLSQRQILTPGLVQMVSVLALNKLELKDMINAEMVENPVLEELEDAVPLLDDVGRQEEERDRLASKATSEEAPPVADEKKDPFEEIDFGSFFQDYLDPGYRSSGEMEEIEKPSFENFLSKPGNLSDHLLWQLGAISVRPTVHQAAQLIIGNLNEEGYLIASDEELLGIVPVAPPEADVEVAAKIVGEAEALGLVVSENVPETAISMQTALLDLSWRLLFLRPAPPLVKTRVVRNRRRKVLNLSGERRGFLATGEAEPGHEATAVPEPAQRAQTDAHSEPAAEVQKAEMHQTDVSPRAPLPPEQR